MEKTSSFGIVLTKTTSPTVIVQEVYEIDGVGYETDEVEVTSHDSENRTREFVGTLKDAGEIAISAWVKDQDNFIALEALGASSERVDWSMTLPNGMTIIFKAYVKTFEMANLGIEDALGFNMTLRLIAKPAYAKAVESA